MSSESFIVFCPVCCSTVDAEVADGEDRAKELECSGCGQTWVMEIDESRMHQHSVS